jgi:UDP-N-acetylmuramoyl-tripeptide--D-alanyl-D-alanine ligase
MTISVIVVLWLPQIIGQILNWIYWLQVKEYRFDRFWVFLQSKSGRKKLGTGGILSKFALLILALYFDLFFWPTLLLFLVLDFWVIKDIWKRGLRRPVFTQRARRILGTTGFFVLLTVVILYQSFFIRPRGVHSITPGVVLFFGEILLLVSPFLGILWTTPIVNKVKKQEVEKAKKRLKKIKPKVIGITGSYGKGTTKEFLAHLLSQKFNVEKTVGSQNTEFGIARKAQKIKKETEFFIVEMGAYKRGEISKLCGIVKPEVAIITGIEIQHLALFGSLENIKRTKYELIESLPEGGMAVFNLSNSFCVDLFKKTKKERSDLAAYGYILEGGSEKTKAIFADIKAKMVSVDINGVNFEVSDSKVVKKLFIPVAGVHFVENMAGAILMARHFGVNWKQIEKGCRSIEAPKKTMQTCKLKGAVIIDDTFNNTPKGFEAALSYLSLYEKKKAVITPGIIELGAESIKVHHKLGEIMSGFVDKIVLTNNDSTGAIKVGLGNNGYKLTVEKNPEKLVKVVSKLINDEYVILLEGRLPSVLMDYLNSQMVSG